MNSFLTPFKESIIFKILFAIAIFFYSLMTAAQADKNSELFKTLKAKDSILFEISFNTCELEKLAPIIANDFEFYHDIGGIQDKKGFMDALKNNLCSKPGNNKRNLVKNSLQVFPLNNNGKL